MRVLVTGTAGFVGSHLAEALLADGHEVVGLDAFLDYYSRELKKRNIEGLLRHPRFHFHELDLRTDPLDKVLAGVDAIVNEAAMPGLPKSWTSFDTYVSCNLIAAQRLLEASRLARISRFVQISTSSVYGENAVGDETIPVQPVSPYGLTKLAAEHLVLSYVRAYETPAVILRYFSIYGPRQRPDMAYRIFIDAMLHDRPITVFGDGEQSRTSTFVADAVRGTIQALEHAPIGEIYNIGGGASITLNRAIEMIAEATAATPRIEHAPALAGDQRHTNADTTKAREAFGYEPRTLPEEGLRRQVDWQREELTATGPDMLSATR